MFCFVIIGKFYLDKYRRGDLLKVEEKEITIVLACFILSTIFFYLTMFSTRRAYDFWAGFMIMTIGGVITYIVPKLNFNLREILRDSLKYGILFLFIFSIFYSTFRNNISMKENVFRPDRLREVSLWLKDNSKEGDIVFNLNWGMFSQMFFWNQKNYYIGGLDPIFQYTYNLELYWKFHYLSLDMVTKKDLRT